MDIDRFIQDCIDANAEADSQAAVLEVLARAVSDPRGMLAALGEPTAAGINELYRSPTLTIFSATWIPQMNLMPHNHLMWANIGIYTGREDNILWRSIDGSIEAFGAKALFEGQAPRFPRPQFTRSPIPCSASPAASISMAVIFSIPPAAFGIRKRCKRNPRTGR